MRPQPLFRRSDDLPPGVTDADIERRFGDATEADCIECGRRFIPSFDGEDMCPRCQAAEDAGD